FWEFKSPSGSLFGIGSGFTHTWWVKIVASLPQQIITAFDFTQNVCSAQWIYDGGPIPCPLNPNKINYGYVQQLDNPVLENGLPAGAPSLLTVPQNKFNGFIKGVYQTPQLLPGDHFQTTIGCQSGAFNCYVNYELDYISAGNSAT